MGGEGEIGFKGDAEELRSFCEGKGDVIDGYIGMKVGLVLVWGEKGDGGFVGGNGKAVGGCPVRDGGKVGVS